MQVLEEDEYHRRKGFYLESAQRHYYFMNVGNGEVIDACRRVRLLLDAAHEQYLYYSRTMLAPAVRPDDH